MGILKLYLLSCVIVYAYFVVKNPISFKDVSKMDVVRGIIGTLVWPITLTIMYFPFEKFKEQKFMELLHLTFNFLTSLFNVFIYLFNMVLLLIVLVWSIYGGTLKVGSFLTITLNGIVKTENK